jgi:hypothetical protein
MKRQVKNIQITINQSQWIRILYIIVDRRVEQTMAVELSSNQPLGKIIKYNLLIMDRIDSQILILTTSEVLHQVKGISLMFKLWNSKIIRVMLVEFPINQLIIMAKKTKYRKNSYKNKFKN